MSNQKAKLQLRPSFRKSEKSPPPSKLFLSHGKPNYTISRSPKTPTNTSNPMSPEANELERVMLKRVPSANGSVKSDTSTSSILSSSPTLTTPTAITPKSITPTTTPFGTLKATKANHFNGSAPEPIPISNENEIGRVVLRSTNQVTLRNPCLGDRKNDEPEFITAQRKIAGRLAQDENSFDIELAKKRSSYTEILSTPTLSKAPQFIEIEKGRINSATLFEEPSIESIGKADIIAASTKPSAELISDETTEKLVSNKPETLNNVIEEIKQSVPPIQENGKVDNESETRKTNGNTNENFQNEEDEPTSLPKPNDDAITNGNNNNTESNSVGSFAQDVLEPSHAIASKPVQKDMDRATLDDLAKLKFDIETNGQDVVVTQVIRTD